MVITLLWTIIGGILGILVGYAYGKEGLLCLSDITTFLKFVMTIIWLTLTKPIFLVLLWNSW